MHSCCMLFYPRSQVLLSVLTVITYCPDKVYCSYGSEGIISRPDLTEA